MSSKHYLEAQERIAAKEAERLATKDRAAKRASLKEVANAGNKPVVIQSKQELPDGVNFFDPNQASHLGKCILLRGLNFPLGVKDAYALLTPFEVSVVANAAQQSAEIQASIEEA